MAKILNAGQSYYRVFVTPGGIIELDTGSLSGEVRITGDLIVQGETTTIKTTNMEVEDNIIRLNRGGYTDDIIGITDIVSGIEIIRGPTTDLEISNPENAQFLFDESVSHYDSYVGDDVSGTFKVQLANGNLSSIQMRSVTIDPTSTFVFDMQNSSSTLRVVNSASDYATLVKNGTNDNDIPNKKYVSDYVSASGGTANVSSIYYPLLGQPKSSKVEAKDLLIEFLINGNLTSRIDNTGLTICDGINQSINLNGDAITNVSGTLLLQSTFTNYVEVNSILKLDDQNAFDTVPVSGTSKIYSRSDLTGLDQTPGKTGIFFTNSVNSDELVSKNRALLFSILF